MRHKDYLMGMTIYDIANGIIELHEKHEYERREFNELFHVIKEGYDINTIEVRLDDLLCTMSTNYFCRGIKMGMEIALSLSTSNLPDDED